MLSFGCSLLVFAPLATFSSAVSQWDFFHEAFPAGEEKYAGPWATPPESAGRPWQIVEQPLKRGRGSSSGARTSYPFRIRVAEERNVNSQQKRGMGVPVVERGEERCNLMNLLHPVILNLPMITQVNKREPAQVITKLQKKDWNVPKSEPSQQPVGDFPRLPGLPFSTLVPSAPKWKGEGGQ